MSAEINYKNKYMELRSKYLEDVDMAFRLGFEQGGMQAQQDQMAQEQQQAQEIQQAAAGGAVGQEGGAPGGEQPQEAGQPPSEHPEGSELDQHIAKLESMIAKAEKAAPDELKKSVQEFQSLGNDLRNLQKAWKQQADLRKSAACIPAIAKALHKPAFKMGRQASINLNSNAKQAVSMQHKIVSDVMQKMQMEEQRAKAEIPAILNSIKG